MNIAPIWLEAMLGLLAAGNLFFIKRLVAKIDNMDEILSKNMPVWQQEMAQMKESLYQLRLDIRDIAELKRDVAVLQTVIEHWKITFQKGE